MGETKHYIPVFIDKGLTKETVMGNEMKIKILLFLSDDMFAKGKAKIATGVSDLGIPQKMPENKKIDLSFLLT